MKKIAFDRYQQENYARFVRLALNSRPTRRKMVRRKPRDPEEEKILTEMVKEQWRRWQKEGKLRILGSRKFRLE